MVFSLTALKLCLRASRSNHAVSLSRWKAICSYKDSVAPDPPTQRCDGPMGGDRSGAFAFSCSKASTRAAAGRAEPSGAEVSGARRENRCSRSPPLVTEQMLLHGGARSKTRAPVVSQREKMFTRNRETVFIVSKLCGGSVIRLSARVYISQGKTVTSRLLIHSIHPSK